MSLDEKTNSKLRKLLQDRLQKTGAGGCVRCGKLKEQPQKKHCDRCLNWYSARAKRTRLCKRLEKSKTLPTLALDEHMGRILERLDEAHKRIAKLEAEASEREARDKSTAKAIGRIEMKIASMDRRMANQYKRGWYMGAVNARQLLEKPTAENFAPASTDLSELSQISHVYQRE